MAYFSKIRNHVVDILNNVFLFKYLYVILAFISFIPVTRIYLGFLTKLILLWGAYLIINRLAIKRDYNTKSGILFLVLLIASYFLTLTLNFTNEFARNVLNACYLSINLLVVYGLDEKKKPEELINDFRSINLLLVILTGVMSLISLFMFIFLIKYKLTVDGMHWNQGFVYNRLYGVYSSANAGGMVAVISVAATAINLWLMRGSPNKKLRIMYIANIVVQTLYIVLTDSRGAQVGAVSLFIVAMFFYLREKFLYDRVNILEFWTSIALCIIVSVAGMVLTAPVKKALSYIPNLTSNFVPSIKQRMALSDDSLIPYANIKSLLTKGAYSKSAILALEKQTKDGLSSSVVASTNKQDLSSNKSSSTKPATNAKSVAVGRVSYDLTGNRTTIWIAQFKVWETSPILGVGNSMLSYNHQKFDYVQTLNKKDRSELLRSDGNAHNGYLQLLVMGGSIAFILFAAFWFILLRKTLSNLWFRKLERKDILTVSVTFAIVVSLLINNISESHLILRNADFVGVITWVYTGYLFYFINSPKKTTETEEVKS